MRLIYFYSPANYKSGVDKKVLAQVQNLRRSGVDAELLLINETELPSPIFSHCAERVIRINQILWLIKPIAIIWREKLRVDILKEYQQTQVGDGIIYMRSPYPSLHLWLFLRRFHSVKIITEHQTMEWKEYKLQKKYCYLIADLLVGRSIRRHTNGFVSVTNEISQYQIEASGNPNKPHITIGNGFDIQSTSLRHPPWFDGTTLNLLCVANVSRWHGLDRLLRGLATYNETPKVILHVAGDGAELPHLQKLAGDLGISDRMVFHGFTTGKALDALFDQCHIAVGSLGIHRIGLKEASILKAREYCARGIPFIYGIPDPDFPPDFPYILHLPADESPIDVEQVLAFAKKVSADPDHPEKMRRYAEEHLDWSVKMKILKGFLETLIGEDGNESVPEADTASLAATGLKAPGGTVLSGAVQGDMPSGASRERGL